MRWKEIQKEIPLSDIKVRPEPFCISYGFDSPKLMHSIKEIGLINPPLLIKRNNNPLYEIVFGLKRILAFKELGYKTIPCRIIDDPNIKEHELLLISLYDNLITRSLNEVEKAIFLKRISYHLPKEMIVEKYLPLLDIPKREDSLELYLFIDQLDENSKRLIAKRAINIKTLKLLRFFGKKDIEKLVSYINILKLNFNFQIEFIEALLDLSIREDRSIADILADKSIRDIVEGDLNPSLKIKRLFEYLRSRRYPRYMKEEERFRKIIKSIKLPPNIEISHSPYFEGEGYICKIRFRDGMELGDILGELIKNEKIKEIRRV